MRLTPENNLVKLYPKLAKEWHPTKNKPLTPDQVSPGSNKKVWWICKQGHEWEAIMKSRSIGTGCIKCYNERRRGIKNKKV